MNYEHEGQKIKDQFNMLVKQYKKHEKRKSDLHHLDPEFQLKDEQLNNEISMFYKKYGSFIRKRKNSIGVFSVEDFVSYYKSIEVNKPREHLSDEIQNENNSKEFKFVNENGLRQENNNSGFNNEISRNLHADNSISNNSKFYKSHTNLIDTNFAPNNLKYANFIDNNFTNSNLIENPRMFTNEEIFTNSHISLKKDIFEENKLTFDYTPPKYQKLEEPSENNLSEFKFDDGSIDENSGNILDKGGLNSGIADESNTINISIENKINNGSFDKDNKNNIDEISIDNDRFDKIGIEKLTENNFFNNKADFINNTNTKKTENGSFVFSNEINNNVPPGHSATSPGLVNILVDHPNFIKPNMNTANLGFSNSYKSVKDFRNQPPITLNQPQTVNSNLRYTNTTQRKNKGHFNVSNINYLNNTNIHTSNLNPLNPHNINNLNPLINNVHKSNIQNLNYMQNINPLINSSNYIQNTNPLINNLNNTNMNTPLEIFRATNKYSAPHINSKFRTITGTYENIKHMPLRPNYSSSSVPHRNVYIDPRSPLNNLNPRSPLNQFNNGSPLNHFDNRSPIQNYTNINNRTNLNNINRNKYNIGAPGRHLHLQQKPITNFYRKDIYSQNLRNKHPNSHNLPPQYNLSPPYNSFAQYYNQSNPPTEQFMTYEKYIGSGLSMDEVIKDKRVKINSMNSPSINNTPFVNDVTENKKFNYSNFNNDKFDNEYKINEFNPEHANSGERYLSENCFLNDNEEFEYLETYLKEVGNEDDILEKESKELLYTVCDNFIEHTLVMTNLMIRSMGKRTFDKDDIKLIFKIEYGIELPDDFS